MWAFFLPFYIFLISICLLSLIWRPTLICIFIERCTVWRESLFPADFFKYNSGGSSKDRPHHALLWLLLCFPVCDRNGRWQWLMLVGRQLGGTDAITYLQSPWSRQKERRNHVFPSKMAFLFPLMIMVLHHYGTFQSFLASYVVRLHSCRRSGVNLEMQM